MVRISFPAQRAPAPGKRTEQARTYRRCSAMLNPPPSEAPGREKRQGPFPRDGTEEQVVERDPPGPPDPLVPHGEQGPPHVADPQRRGDELAVGHLLGAVVEGGETADSGPCDRRGAGGRAPAGR